jgi:hypothetical protein
MWTRNNGNNAQKLSAEQSYLGDNIFQVELNLSRDRASHQPKQKMLPSDSFCISISALFWLDGISPNWDWSFPSPNAETRDGAKRNNSAVQGVWQKIPAESHRASHPPKPKCCHQRYEFFL